MRPPGTPSVGMGVERPAAAVAFDEVVERGQLAPASCGSAPLSGHDHEDVAAVSDDAVPLEEGADRRWAGARARGSRDEVFAPVGHGDPVAHRPDVDGGRLDPHRALLLGVELGALRARHIARLEPEGVVGGGADLESRQAVEQLVGEPVLGKDQGGRHRSLAPDRSPAPRSHSPLSGTCAVETVEPRLSRFGARRVTVLSSRGPAPTAGAIELRVRGPRRTMSSPAEPAGS